MSILKCSFNCQEFLKRPLKVLSIAPRGRGEATKSSSENSNHLDKSSSENSNQLEQQSSQARPLLVPSAKPSGANGKGSNSSRKALEVKFPHKSSIKRAENVRKGVKVILLEKIQ